MKNNSPIVLSIAQARLGSERLPGKVLKPILGKPMLWYQVKQMQASKLSTYVIVATADNYENKLLVEFCHDSNILVYAGSEKDLVDRYYQAAKQYNADIIVRVTGDCPLTDPTIIDACIEYFIENNNMYDYVSNNRVHHLPHGMDVEVFSFYALEKVWKETTDPFQREWFTTNFFENPDIYKIGSVVLNGYSDLENIRLTVDYPEDFQLVEEIIKNLDGKNSVIHLDQILDLLKSNSSLLEINKDYSSSNLYTGLNEARKLYKEKKITYE